MSSPAEAAKDHNVEKLDHSPREFLKSRRPERFSDSIVENEVTLDRSTLEYYLDSLTSRSQETDFEHFARHLAEREVCPNLLPQTGPTGGGDSKVDAETYPVSDNLTLAWYVGVGREAGSERWAFAFSAKREWLSKVRSDVAKIAETDRGYTCAFFITNQFVPDKKRAKVEDELRAKHNLDVRILDRSWLLDRVFAGKHESLAIEDLRIQTSMNRQIRKGPQDLRREQELDEIEARIESVSRDGRFGFQYVEDCTQAASLARDLERPRTETDGRFVRAERAAMKYGNHHQQLVVAYDKAWTAYWWYEDYDLFCELYSPVEDLAKGTINAHELELLTNLWIILYPLSKLDPVDKVRCGIKDRTVTLTAELDRLSKEENSPSNALQARTSLLLMELFSTHPKDAGPVLLALQDVVQQCAGLLGYPLEPLAEILSEIGLLLGDLESYKELLETIVEVSASRDGEVCAARLLLKCGSQHLKAERPYEAIRYIGRALARLYKNESRHDLVRALYLCGHAYESVGLFWAARGTLLTAASLAMNEFWTYADITTQQANCVNRLKWLELRLGRVAFVLAWHQIDRTIRSVLMEKGLEKEQLEHGELEFDGILGILLLRSNLTQLSLLTTLPDVLDALGLRGAAIALLYALGHEDELPEEAIANGDGALYDYFRAWHDQPGGKEIPDSPSLYDEQTVTLISNLLGCRIELICQNTLSCIQLSESTLAALESLLSTGIVDGMVAREPVLHLTVHETEDAEVPFSFTESYSEGIPYVEVKCAVADPNSMGLEAQVAIKDRVFAIIRG